MSPMVITKAQQLDESNGDYKGTVENFKRVGWVQWWSQRHNNWMSPMVITKVQ